MNKLNSSELQFVELMGQSSEQADHGFSKLANQKTPERFLVAITTAGFFKPEANPAPISSEKENMYSIRAWRAMDYLQSVAKRATELANPLLAKQVLDLCHAIVTFREIDDSPRDNYYTHRDIAQIYGLVPLESIQQREIDAVPVLLSSRFYTVLASQALEAGLLRKCLDSDEPQNLKFAAQLLVEFTATRWVSKTNGHADAEPSLQEPITVVETYWLKDVFEKHRKAIAEKIAHPAAQVLAKRIADCFPAPPSGLPSWAYRSSIESSEQNWQVEDVRDVLVDELRELTDAWLGYAPSEALQWVATLFDSDAVILHRFALYAAQGHFASLRKSFFRWFNLQNRLHAEYRHELHDLLSVQFSQFADEEKSQILNAILSIPLFEGIENAQKHHEYGQRIWLSAIVGQGLAAADECDARLQASLGSDVQIVDPNFSSFHEQWSGSGNSVMTPDELAALATADGAQLVAELNKFEPESDHKREAKTLRALCDVLAMTVRDQTQAFVQVISDFVNAKTCFKYAVLDGLRDAWRKRETPNATAAAWVDWDTAWAGAFDLIAHIVKSENFGQAIENEFGERWLVVMGAAQLPNACMALLSDGSRKDSNRHPDKHLSVAITLIATALEKLKPDNEWHEKALNWAINRPRGKAVEALVSHALRICRQASSQSGSHGAVWQTIQPTFDAELNRIVNGNFEFFAIAAYRLPQMYYLDATWAKAALPRLFPVTAPKSFAAALDGLGYCNSLAKTHYDDLKQNGTIRQALDIDIASKQARTYLLQNIARAYWGGDEMLDGNLFTHLIQSQRWPDLTVIADYFVSSRRHIVGASDEARIVGAVLQFWREMLKAGGDDPLALSNLRLHLAGLMRFIGKIDADSLPLLTAAAKAQTQQSMTVFLADLIRIAETNLTGTADLLEIAELAAHPFWDHDDNLKTLLRRLYENDSTRARARTLANAFRDVEGVKEWASIHCV